MTLPQSSQQTTPRAITRIILTRDLQYFVGMEGEEDRAVTFEEIAPYLEASKQANPDMYVALYADEEVPYREIVKLLNIAVENHYQMVLATRALE